VESTIRSKCSRIARGSSVPRRKPASTSSLPARREQPAAHQPVDEAIVADVAAREHDVAGIEVDPLLDATATQREPAVEVGAVQLPQQTWDLDAIEATVAIDGQRRAATRAIVQRRGWLVHLVEACRARAHVAPRPRGIALRVHRTRRLPAALEQQRGLARARARIGGDLDAAGTHATAELEPQRGVGGIEDLADRIIDVGHRVEAEHAEVHVVRGVARFRARAQAFLEHVERAMQLTDRGIGVRARRRSIADRRRAGRSGQRRLGGADDLRALRRGFVGGPVVAWLRTRLIVGRIRLASLRALRGRARQCFEGGGELLLADRLLEEMIGTEVEHVGEIADRSAESTAQRDRDRSTLSGAAQLGHEHGRVGSHGTHHDRRGDGPVAEATRERIRGATGRLVAERVDTTRKAGTPRLVAHDEDLRSHR
jgi:hypothetical protein